MNRIYRRLWGLFSPLGWGIAAFGFLADRSLQWWLLAVFDIVHRQPVAPTPFLNVVLVWNRGISYGLFEQNTAAGRWGLVAMAILMVVALAFWIAATRRPVTAAALGLVQGGALGNVADRVIYGRVADFFDLHAYGFHWYVFNLADVMIVSGAALLIYDRWIENRGLRFARRGRR